MAFVPQIPRISISPPPPEDPSFEPYSPFPVVQIGNYDEDGFRSRHLTPPPTVTGFKRPLSPPTPDATFRKGLDSQQFKALLRSSRGGTMHTVPKKDVDLRKEIALKATKNKQAERRALFLSKVQAPPSPTATLTPNTPPDSPSIFHYTLPSPGLVSPLALFETLDEHDRAPNARVEEVDFRAVIDQQRKVENLDNRRAKPKPKALALPSLDQISARMLPHAQQQRGGSTLQPPQVSYPQSLQSPPPVRPSVGTGRLRLPLRQRPRPVPLSLPAPEPDMCYSSTANVLPLTRPGTSPVPAAYSSPVPQPPPRTLSGNTNVSSPQLQITTPDMQVANLVHPSRARRLSNSLNAVPTMKTPTPLTESNLNCLNTRDQKAHTMLSTLKRRTIHQSTAPITPAQLSALASTEFHKGGITTPVSAPYATLGNGLGPLVDEADKYKWRRRSAPADVMVRARTGFEHPVLSHPAGF